MPSLRKKTLSLYLRTGCLRQLVLSLYGDKDRRDRGMPQRQKVRPGLGLVGEAGYQWQDRKVSELADVFGEERVHAGPVTPRGRPSELELAHVLPRVKPFEFIVEGRYDAQTEEFRRGVGISELYDQRGEPLRVGDAYPDIIQVLPSLAARQAWEIRAEEEGPHPLALEVLPTGDVRLLASNDRRLRLRVIDMALPGSQWDAESSWVS